MLTRTGGLGSVSVPGGADGHGGPGAVGGEDLEAGLALETKQKGDGAVVGVGAGAEVAGRVGGRLGGRVAEEAERGARAVLAGEVGRGEEVADLACGALRMRATVCIDAALIGRGKGEGGRGEEKRDRFAQLMSGAAYIEAQAQQVEDPEAEAAARVGKGAELRLLVGHGRGQRLLGLAVDELAKIEGPWAASEGSADARSLADAPLDAHSLKSPPWSETGQERAETGPWPEHRDGLAFWRAGSSASTCMAAQSRLWAMAQRRFSSSGASKRSLACGARRACQRRRGGRGGGGGRLASAKAWATAAGEGAPPGSRT